MKFSVGVFTHYGHISLVGSELLLTVPEGYPLVPEGYLYKLSVSDMVPEGHIYKGRFYSVS